MARLAGEAPRSSGAKLTPGDMMLETRDSVHSRRHCGPWYPGFLDLWLLEGV